MAVGSLVVAGVVALAASLPAEIKVTAERGGAETGFKFNTVPAPANNDAATKAKVTLVDGERDTNGGELAVLHDGKVPAEEDQPSANFFFRAGTDGGRVAIDLGSALSVKSISTYSWHAGTRGPQVYKLYAADGTATGFNAAPKRGTDPESCGWKLVASVDTRPKEGEGGGRHGVIIADSASGAVGSYRHLLFDMAQTEDRDAFGNTFYSEIDVIDANGPAPTSTTSGEGPPILTQFETEGGKYKFTIDSTAAPDLKEWAESKLKPVVQEWYPKIVAMLPSDEFEAPSSFTLQFRNNMGGTPASAGGGRVNMNSGWFRRELNREALGAVVHEMVHVVQNYGRARRTNPNATRTPGWLVEGIPDYIRWFLYEPQTKGAELTERNIARAKFDASYRISGNFLDWVTRTHDKEVVRKLNATCREGKYTEQLWKDWTGKTIQELADDWIKTNQKRIEEAKAKAAEPK
jgi:hypothetical protein